MTTSDPKISILIPTYNRASYLREAIETSLGQNYPNFEVIVSDNASTDETKEVVRKYLGDLRLRYYCNDQNLGSGLNYWKLLYEYATGEFAHFLTDDDYFIDRDHLTKAIRIVKKYGIRVVFSGAESRVEGEREGRSLSLGLEEAVHQEWWLENLCRTRGGLTVFPSCGSGTLFEIAKAKELNAFDTRPYGDYEFALKCLISYPQVGYIKEPQYVERRHEGQDGRTSYQNAFQGTQIFDRVYEYGLQMLIDPRVMAEIRFRGFLHLIRGWLLPNWIREKGNSFSSLRGFLKELAKFDGRLPRAALLDPNTMAQFIFFGTPVYSFLKKIYLHYRGYYSRYDKK